VASSLIETETSTEVCREWRAWETANTEGFEERQSSFAALLIRRQFDQALQTALFRFLVCFILGQVGKLRREKCRILAAFRVVSKCGPCVFCHKEGHEFPPLTFLILF